MFETAAIRQEHVSLKNAVHQFTPRPRAAAEVLTMRRLDGGRTDLAGALREFTRGVLPDAPLFRMPAKGHVAEMLKADLADAGIQYRDDAGRVFDFHGLRHFFITALSRANVHPRTAQELARHSSIGLTMSVYTHMARVELVDALRELPDLE